MSPKQRVKFFEDSDKIIADIMGADNIRATALHRDEQGEHKHYFGMGFTKQGELCVDKIINPQLYKRLNQEYPCRMREMGWDIDDCTIYDAEKAKGMSEDEAVAYRSECRTKRRQKRSGLDSKTYKEKKELEKIERQKDKARLSRDLAIAATQQARQQVTATIQQKAALETDIAALQKQADSYPTDLQQHLDALADAANEYRAATAADEGGPLSQFLRKIQVQQKKKDGTIVKRSVFDLWMEYRQKQDQRLQAQAEQARQEAQYRLPVLRSTAAQHGDFLHDMNF